MPLVNISDSAEELSPVFRGVQLGKNQTQGSQVSEMNWCEIFHGPRCLFAVRHFIVRKS